MNGIIEPHQRPSVFIICGSDRGGGLSMGRGEGLSPSAVHCRDFGTENRLDELSERPRVEERVDEAWGGIWRRASDQ